MAIGSFAIPMIQVSAYIAAKYSLRRTVIDANERRPKPIISFMTQKIPVCTALAQAAVLKVFHEKVVEMFQDTTVDLRIRHAVASVFKVATVLHGQATTWTLGDRCGSQGLFEANQITAMNVSTLSPRVSPLMLTDVYCLPCSLTCGERPLPKAIFWSFRFVNKIPACCVFSYSQSPHVLIDYRICVRAPPRALRSSPQRRPNQSPCPS